MQDDGFGTFRNLLLARGAEESMVARLEASSVLNADCGPEKVLSLLALLVQNYKY
jgi:hypothetical protein